MSDQPKCRLCGEPMPPGEEMFTYHGYSGGCPKDSRVETSPKCRVCNSDKGVLVYPEDSTQAICPDCCDKAEHADGETGHVWEYDRHERGSVCIHCGICRRDTGYASDD